MPWLARPRVASASRTLQRSHCSRRARLGLHRCPSRCAAVVLLVSPSWSSRVRCLSRRAMLQCLAGYFVEAFAKNLLAVVWVFHETFVRGENSFLVTASSPVFRMWRALLFTCSQKKKKMLRQRLRVNNYFILNVNETFEFAYLGPAEGQRRLHKDSTEHQERVNRQAREMDLQRQIW